MSEKEDAPSPVEDNNFQHLLTTVSDVEGMVKNYCKEKTIVDPVDILKSFQKHIVTGRKLDLVNNSETIEGLTKIMVDRHNILKTAVDEIQSLEDLRPCLEVQFYGEVKFLCYLCLGVLKHS